MDLHPSDLKPLIRAPRLAARVRQLGQQLGKIHRNQDLMLAILLDGAACFATDLMRAIPHPGLEIRFLKASSYGHATRSSGSVAVGEVPDCRGRRVVVVDDILDTGRTLKTVTEALEQAKAAEVTSCVLLDKPARRAVDFEADHVGFTIPDTFVVGYGLDFGGKYRHLPDVCRLRDESKLG